MAVEECYARFSVLLVSLAAGVALMGTLTAVMLVEELRRRKKLGLPLTLEVCFSLALGGVGFWATQQVVSMAVTIVCDTTGQHPMTTDATGLCGSLACVLILMTIGLRVSLRDKYFGVSKQKRITLLSKDIRRIVRTRSKVKGSKLVEKRAMVANLGVIVWGGLLTSGGVLGMEYTGLRSLAVAGYTVVYLPTYMAFAACIGVLVVPVGYWLSFRVMQWRQKDEVLRRLTAVLLGIGAVALHLVALIGLKFVPDPIGAAPHVVKNTLAMHPGHVTRWWFGVLLASVAVCIFINYRMVLRERFDLTRVLDDVEDLGSTYTRLRSTQTTGGDDGGYRTRVDAFLAKSSKFLDKHMQDYKTALALAAEKESKKTQNKPNAAANEKMEGEDDQDKAAKKTKGRSADGRKAAQEDTEGAEADSPPSIKKPPVRLSAGSPPVSAIYGRPAPKRDNSSGKRSSRTSSQKVINSPTDYELQLHVRSRSNSSGRGRGRRTPGIPRSEEESEGSSGSSSEGQIASASSDSVYIAPPANHRAILNMLLGNSVDLSRSDFMRTEVLRRAEVHDPRGPGQAVPDSEFGSYESWGQKGSSAGPQARRDESSTASPNISLSEIAAINNRLNQDRQQTERSPSVGTSSLASPSPHATSGPLPAGEDANGEGTSLRVPTLQLVPEQRLIPVTALPSVLESRQVTWLTDQRRELPPALDAITPCVVGSSPQLAGVPDSGASPQIVGYLPPDAHTPPTAAAAGQGPTNADRSPGKKDAPTPCSTTVSPAHGDRERQSNTSARAGLEEGEECVVRIKLVGPSTVRVASCVFGEDGEAKDEVTTLLEGEAAAALLAGLRGEQIRRHKKTHRYRHSGPTEPQGACTRRSSHSRSSHGSCSSGHKCEPKSDGDEDVDVLVAGHMKTWEATKLLDGLMQFSPVKTMKEGGQREQTTQDANRGAQTGRHERRVLQKALSESSHESSGEKGSPLVRMARFAVGAITRSNTNGAVVLLGRTRGVQPDAPQTNPEGQQQAPPDARSALSPGEFPTLIADEAALPRSSQPSSASNVSSISS